MSVFLGSLFLILSFCWVCHLFSIFLLQFKQPIAGLHPTGHCSDHFIPQSILFQNYVPSLHQIIGGKNTMWHPMSTFEYFIKLIHSCWIIPPTSTEIPAIILPSEVQPPALTLCALSFSIIPYHSAVTVVAKVFYETKISI